MVDRNINIQTLLTGLIISLMTSSVVVVVIIIIIMKLWIYEIHIFELRNEELNVKRILAVINATYAVAKRKPEKKQACRDSNPDLCDTGAAL